MLTLGAFLLQACYPYSATLPPPMPLWQYADLRILDPVDASKATQDIVAVYLRHKQNQVQIRLDWLDLEEKLEHDIYISFYTAVSNVDRPVLELIIPANGDMYVLCEGQPFVLSGLRLFEDSFYDFSVVSFNDDVKWLHAAYWVSIRVTSPGKLTEILDEIPAFYSNAHPPEPVPVLLAFWNTFTALNSAQALRQWDGAHSGPLGERHGLRYLLSAAASVGTPIFLMDLKTPTSLSALDYIGGIKIVQALSKQGWVTLPNVILTDISNPTLPNWVYQRLAKESHQTGLDFSLPDNRFLYTPSIVPQELTKQYKTLFSFDTTSTPANSTLVNICHSQEQQWLRLPGSPTPDQVDNQQATDGGPSMKIRKAFANYGNGYTQNTTIIMLGGDFANSTWGMPQAVRATLSYIHMRPWIQILTPQALQEFSSVSPTCPTASTQNQQTDNTQLHKKLLAEFEHTPDNIFRSVAWQMYTTQLIPATPKQVDLRTNYLGQIGHILAIAHWASQPTQIADCKHDLDWDGQAECRLASETFFASIEKDGAYVSFAAALTSDGMHQIIAPTWQFGTGWSDTMEWQTNHGVASDPAALPGAFFNPAMKWLTYPETQISADKLTLRNEQGQKVFELTQSGLRVTTDSQTAITLGLDTWTRFFPGWSQAYLGTSSAPNTWEWKLNTGITVIIQTHKAFTEAAAFHASRELLENPEDPNYDYPVGHYLPFPLSLVTLSEADVIDLTIWEELPK